MGGPAGIPDAGSLVFHTESAVNAALRGLTVYPTATPLSKVQPAAVVSSVHVPALQIPVPKSPEKPPTCTW